MVGKIIPVHAKLIFYNWIGINEQKVGENLPSVFYTPAQKPPAHALTVADLDHESVRIIKTETILFNRIHLLSTMPIMALRFEVAVRLLFRVANGGCDPTILGSIKSTGNEVGSVGIWSSTVRTNFTGFFKTGPLLRKGQI